MIKLRVFVFLLLRLFSSCNNLFCFLCFLQQLRKVISHTHTFAFILYFYFHILFPLSLAYMQIFILMSIEKLQLFFFFKKMLFTSEIKCILFNRDNNVFFSTCFFYLSKKERNFLSFRAEKKPHSVYND